jgi:type II secretory pathway predicted ATPase ExeA
VEHLQHFGLSHDPFCNEPKLDLFLETESNRDALRRLERALRQSKGLCVLIGDVGAGKTMVVRRLLENLEEEVFDASMLVVVHGAADAASMLMRFAAQLGIEEPGREREALLAQIYEQLAIIREDGRHAVLIIDDAQALVSRETLSEVCGLLKLEYEDRRLLSLVLAGVHELDAAITKDPLLAHHVDVKVRLDPLDRDATAAYVAHRVAQAGSKPAIIAPEALDALHRLGGGLPGRMNTLADNALFEAFLCGRREMSRTDVERAQRDLGWEAPEAAESAPRRAPTPAAPAPDAHRAPPVAVAEPTVLFEADPPSPATEIIDPIDGSLSELDADLEAVFEPAIQEQGLEILDDVIPGQPPKDEEEDLLVELLDG